MRILPTTLIMLLAVTPAIGQTPPPPSALGQAAHKSTKAAKPVPVVQAPRNAHAVKPKTTKPAIAATGAAAATPPVSPEGEKPAVEAAPAPPPPDPNKGSVTGLAIPRFMSLRYDDVNLRRGPGTRFPIDWVYHRRDLPVEILRELDDWRLVQDQDNVRGWVRAPALSPRRTVAVREGDRTLRATQDDKADAVAVLKPGVIGRVRACVGPWCEVEVSTYRGWLKRDEFYGVYANENLGG